MPTLSDLSRRPDPFAEACRLAEQLTRMVGAADPKSFRPVETQIGKARATWTLTEWREAALILGHFADELQRRQHEAEEVRRLAALPKKRGPKPKVTTQLSLEALRSFFGLRGPGPPRRISADKERDALYTFLELKAAYEERDGRKYTDLHAAQLLAREWRTARGERLSRATQDANAYAKRISRWRHRYGVPLRTKRRRPQK